METPESEEGMALWSGKDSRNTVEDLGKDQGKRFSRPAGFTHTFTFKGTEMSPYWASIKPIIDFASARAGFDYGRIVRSQANLTLPVPGYKDGDYSGPHIDHPEQSNYLNLGFYPFDSDGDTFIFNESHHDGVPKKVTVGERVNPVQNRIIIFNGWQYHSASSPIEHNKRIFVNFAVEIPKE